MIVLIYQIICYEPIVENFNLDYNLIKETILNNYKNSITFNGKPSLVQFKNEISNILNDFEIERIDFFLKYIEEGKQYLLEITFVINDIVKKFIEIEIFIIKNKINIQEINIKNNDEILNQGYDSNYEYNFEFPEDSFQWTENPVFQNIVAPGKYLSNSRLSGSNLKEIKNLLSNELKNDINSALIMANSTLENRENYYDKGHCFESKTIGISNKNECEQNFGIWDKPCTKNEDCKFYKPITDGKGGRGGCTAGYCEFPIGVERIGFTKERKREQDRVIKLRLGSNYSVSDQIQFDYPKCYCDDPSEISQSCCSNRDYVFR
jgi:hypothetical protein